MRINEVFVIFFLPYSVPELYVNLTFALVKEFNPLNILYMSHILISFGGNKFFDELSFSGVRRTYDTYFETDLGRVQIIDHLRIGFHWALDKHRALQKTVYLNLLANFSITKQFSHWQADLLRAGRSFHINFTLTCWQLIHFLLKT